MSLDLTTEHPEATGSASPTPRPAEEASGLSAWTQLQFAKASDVSLLQGPALQRARINRDYLMSLTNANLLRPYMFEAALWSWTGSMGTTVGDDDPEGPNTWHWGWEAPTSQLRGHILGHWLSAAAHLAPADAEIKAKAEAIVEELARCQRANGNGWVGPFPETYLDRIRRGQRVWAPHYTIHKLLMGLWDLHSVAGNATSLQILTRFAHWFHAWTEGMEEEQLDDVLDFETGGVLEVWADLLGKTGQEVFADLVHRYDRRRFFNRLTAGEDCLTNRHGNTQVVEVLGAARAYEVTGDVRWRRVVESFWDLAVTRRGTYCTGGSTCGEVWQPLNDVRGRLHSVQEHCTVYNMMRLAEVLYRWTGRREYADYWESNLLNGVWSQQHPRSGMVSYFLPLDAGSKKTWGRATQDFWCCHGTLMQAHTRVASSAVQLDEGGVRISQYLPSVTRWHLPSGESIEVKITQDVREGLTFGQNATPDGLDAIQHLDPHLPEHRPAAMAFDIRIVADRPVRTRLRLRLPGWLLQPARVLVDGVAEETSLEREWLDIEREWQASAVRVELPVGLRTIRQPGDPTRAAVLDGPYVLAGLTSDDSTAVGESARLLIPDQERTHSWWGAGRYRLVRNGAGPVRFLPLNEVRDETYSVYFPIEIEGAAKAD